MREIRLRRGFDLPFAGAPGETVEHGPHVRHVALLGTDFPGVRPSLQVEEGDTVTLGDTLFTDRKRDAIRFCAPGTGRVTAIRRGDRRILLSIVIELTDSATTREVDVPSGAIDSLSGDDVRKCLLDHGLWPALRQRPYGRIPDPDAEPHALFVTAIDSEPLSAEPAVIIGRDADGFRTGLRALSRLHEGPVFVCTSDRFDIDLPDLERLRQVRFRGPHPAGLPGTHIHHLAPASDERPAWHIGYQDVIAVGRLFTKRVIDDRRIIAIGGPAVRRPGLIETRVGADLDRLVRERGLAADARVIAGSPLSGREWNPEQHFLGFYDRQVSVVVEAMAALEREDPPGDPLSLTGPVARLFARRPRRLDTRRVGRPAGLVPFEIYERVFPLDLPVIPLLRSLVASDAERAMELGALELAEEDMGLLSAVCPARYDYASALRAFIDGETRGS